jgi:hypothetical protein
MSTTYLPPIGSVWVHTKDPSDIVIVKGYNTVTPQNNRDQKNNVIRIHRVKTNTPTIEITHMFTWHYKLLGAQHELSTAKPDGIPK